MDSISSKNWKLWWYAMHPEMAPDLCHGGPDTTMSCAYLGHTSLPDARRAGSGQPYPGRTWQVHSGSAWSAQTLVEGPCSHGSLEQETALEGEESKKGTSLLNPGTYIIYSSCCFYCFGSITSLRYIRLWFYFKIYFTSYPCCGRVWMHVSVWSQCVSWPEAKSGEDILFFHHGLWGSNWGCQGCTESTSHYCGSSLCPARSPLHSRLPQSVYWHRGSSRVVAVSPVHCSSCCSASGCTLTAVPVKRILASLSQLILHQNPGSVFINFKNFTGTNSPSILVGFYMVCIILKHGRTKYGRHHFWLLWSLSFSRLNVPHSKEWIILQMTGLTCFLILKVYWPSILSVLDHSWNEGCRINITD